jgi:hypothetical protein
MTTDIQTQIRDFAAEFAADLPSVDVESIISGRETYPVISSVPTPNRSFTVGHRRRQLSGWVAAVTAALVVIVAIGGTTWLLRSAATDIADEPVTPTAEAVVTPDAAIPQSVFGSGWVAVEPDAFTGSVPEYVDSVLELDSMLLAKGGTCDIPGCRVSVWTSSDGELWSEVPDAAAVFADSSQMVWASADDGIVGVGSVCTGAGSGERDGAELECHMAAWWSSDGVVWTRSPDDGGFPPSCTTCEIGVDEVVVTPFGVVASAAISQILETNRPTVDDEVDDESLLLFSADGIEWEISVSQPSAAERFESLLQVGDSVFAIGTHALWTSSDGRTWNQAVDGYGPPHSFEDVVVFSNRIVAVGANSPDDLPARAAAWHSEDGVTWQQATMVDATIGEASSLVTVAIINESLVALSVPDADGLITIWTSSDGLTWTAATATQPEFGMMSTQPDLIATTHGLVAVGFGGFGETGTPLWVWRSIET